MKQSPGTPNKLLTALTGHNSKTIPDHKGLTDTTSNGSGPSVTNSNHSNSVKCSEGDSEDRRSSLKSKLTSDTHGRPFTMTLNRGTTTAKDQSDNNEGNSLGNVSIKLEPETMENTHNCNQSPTDKVCVGLRAGKRTPDKPRRFSFSKVDKSSSLSSLLGCSYGSSDDMGDDLKLSADDVISGVISTPLIKPLEEGDVITTPSPPSVVGGNRTGSNGRSNHSTPPTNPNSAGGTPPPTSSTNQTSTTVTPVSTANSNGGRATAAGSSSSKDSLKQDLDDFSKVMVQVEQEIMHASYPPQLIPQPSTDVYRTSVAPSHIGAPPPQHTISPPPYYPPNRAHHQHSQAQILYPSAGMVSTQPPPVTPHQAGYPPPPPLTPTPSRRPSVQDASLYHPSLEFTSLPSTMAATHTQVDPASYRQLHNTLRAASDRVQKHPQLQHISAAVCSSHMHPQPVLQSPPVRHPTHSSLSQHLPTFPDPNSSMANQIPPRTPTTPLEHFANFPTPSQVQSPTHAHPFFPSSTPQNYPYVHKASADPLRSPTVTSASSNWGNSLQPSGSLKETLLAQVNSHLEVLTGQKRHSQEAGFGLPPAKIPASSSLVHGPLVDSMNMQQFPSTPMDSEFTGPTNSQLLHTIPYQGHSSVTPYPHPHHPL